ncbi:receptor-like protein EIX2 [Abrus precatorius]|uniref:Receptor-like protein EIX2 n=1 Tax=Abrus precatorius TaxID=3816 RepID=A0A8B8M7N1_ABRPR|nr:receptor-like protein EIX2 [Abrus precatorius]
MNTSPPQYAIIFAWFLCVILFMFNTGSGSFMIRCNQKDKHALLNFKQGATDPSSLLSSWSTTKDCCEWRGVTCDNITGRVTELSLPCSTSLHPSYVDKVDKSHCLTGSIHLSFVDLELLNYLDLSNNDFLAIQFDYVNSQYDHNRSLATSLRQSVNSSALRYLDLSVNENLAIDNLRWLSHLSSLEYLILDSIDLHKETNWLQLVTMLPSLTELYLSHCQLKDLSPSLEYANFTSLQGLYLSYNEFDSELPKWLFNLSSGIAYIKFYDNSLKGQLPKALPNLRYLKYLNLAFNNFNGPIPDWLGQLELLQGLYLTANKFSGSIPTNLGNLSSLIALYVGSNNLTGVVSQRNFAKLSKLEYLNICLSPPLIFDFDPNWVPPFQLDYICLAFGGSKPPAWLYTQRSLDFLTIFNSSFEAHDEFWNFASMMNVQLALNDNSIDGDISNVVLNATLIVLSNNNLKGGLPRLSSNVAFIDLSKNLLSGTISPLLCDHKMLNGKSNLLYLDISHNHLSGGLTNCWKNWKSLVHINLGSNILTGEIPPSMGLLSNLIALHLHENELYGEITPMLRNCPLRVFNVRENNLSGYIPNWIAKSAKALQLRSNQFSGNIPPRICQMSSIIILDIGDNRISGHIPNCLNNITSLVFNNASISTLTFYFDLGDVYYYSVESLELFTKGQVSEYKQTLHFMTLVDLSGNDISGTIPPQLFSLIGLHSLNLSFNKLEGRIPEEIGNMKNLESLDLSTNQLWGEIPQSMSYLSFLGVLNLSFNNLTGKIPSGTQLQGFAELSYIGNRDLCGLPLKKICSQDGQSKDTKPTNEDEDESEFLSWLYIGIECGFAVGFLGFCCCIFLNRKWRHAYFKFLYGLKDRLCRGCHQC